MSFRKGWWRLAIILVLCLVSMSCDTVEERKSDDCGNDTLVMEIDSPAHNDELNVNIVNVVGIVSDVDAEVRINGSAAQILREGSFTHYIELVEGKNTLEIMATLENRQCQKTIDVIFSPPLAVNLDIESPANGADLAETPLKVRGVVSSDEAKVQVNGNAVEVAGDGSFSDKVQLEKGSNTIEAIAILDDKRDHWRILTILDEEGRLVYVPGVGSGHREFALKVLYDEIVTIKAGDASQTNITLEFGKPLTSLEPREFEYSIFRIEGEYDESVLSLPNELGIGLEPSQFMAYPNAIYRSTLTIESSPELKSGTYFLRIEGYLRGELCTSGNLKLIVTD